VTQQSEVTEQRVSVNVIKKATVIFLSITSSNLNEKPTIFVNIDSLFTSNLLYFMIRYHGVSVWQLIEDNKKIYEKVN